MTLPLGDWTIDAGFFEAFQGTGGVAERVLYGWVAGITVVG